MRTRLRSLPWRDIRTALVAATVLAASAACNLQIGTGVEAREDWTRTYTIKAGGTLQVRGTNGKIHVVAIDGDKVEVSATKIAKGSTEEAAKATLKDVTIAETATPDRVELDSTTHGIEFALQMSHRVDYEIKVPRSLNVTINTTNGEISVEGVAGLLTVDATNGEITASGLANGADVSSVNGRIGLEFTKLGDAGVRCKTTNGQIVVTIPVASKATLAARVVNGVIQTENLAVQATETSRRRLDATVGGGGPEIRLEATNGEIRVVGK